MIIAVLNLTLRIPGNDSLKGKRRVLKSLKDRLRNVFNIAISEIGYLDHWTLSEIGIASIGKDRSRVESIISKTIEFVRLERNIEVIDEKVQII